MYNIPKMLHRYLCIVHIDITQKIVYNIVTTREQQAGGNGSHRQQTTPVADPPKVDSVETSNER